jgi:hypothetical protein
LPAAIPLGEIRTMHGHPPPPLSPSLYTHTPKGQSGSEALDLCDTRLWRVAFHTRCQPDHVLHRRFFDWTPRSRDTGHCSLTKISEILADANILSTPIFVTFLAWRTSTTRRGIMGRCVPIKAGRAVATLHLSPPIFLFLFRIRMIIYY